MSSVAQRRSVVVSQQHISEPHSCYLNMGNADYFANALFAFGVTRHCHIYPKVSSQFICQSPHTLCMDS